MPAQYVFKLGQLCPAAVLPLGSGTELFPTPRALMRWMHGLAR
jgi:hypothetical protein